MAGARRPRATSAWARPASAAGVAGDRLERAAVLAHGGVDAAVLELEPAEQRAHVGVLLGHRAAGRDRRAHRGQRAVAGRRGARGSRTRARRRRGWACGRPSPAAPSRPAGSARARRERRRPRRRAAITVGASARARSASRRPALKSWRESSSALRCGQRAGVVGAQRQRAVDGALRRARRSRRRRSRAPSAGTRRPAASSRRRAWAPRATVACSALMRWSVDALGAGAGGSAAAASDAAGGEPSRAARTKTGSATAKVATKLMRMRRMGGWPRGGVAGWRGGARSGRGIAAPPARVPPPSGTPWGRPGPARAPARSA